MSHAIFETGWRRTCLSENQIYLVACVLSGNLLRWEAKRLFGNAGLAWCWQGCYWPLSTLVCLPTALPHDLAAHSKHYESEVSGSLRSELGSPRMSLLMHSPSLGQPGFKGWRNGLHLLWEWQVCAGREMLLVAIKGVVNCTGKTLLSLGLLITSRLISVDHVQGKFLHSLK